MTWDHSPPEDQESPEAQETARPARPPRRTRPGPGRRRWLRLLVGVSQSLGQIRRALTSQWLISLAGALAACLLLWFLGPLLSLGGFRPFEDEEPRLAGVIMAMIAWGLFNQMRQVRERRANRRLIRALITATGSGSGTVLPLEPTAPLRLPRRQLADRIPADPGEAGGPGGAEIVGLRRRLTEALTTYSNRLGSSSLRRLPWYLVIGAPGAGKTTAIARSGLTFPLSDLLGRHPIQGVAGTRSCDWWFTSEAVLVDTAGRYTTQDSDRPLDNAAWLGLLNLLKRHRPAQPVNGLVVTVSLADLTGQDGADPLAIADSLNHRLTEIDDRLGVRLPVYLLVTKADRLAGFSEFFSGLSPEERRQVWGLTFPLVGEPAGEPANAAASGTATLADRFSGLFDPLIARLEHRMLERLDQEPDPVCRALIAGFPQQVMAMGAPLTGFLTRTFESASDRPALGRLTLRGLYFTSARREGPPIDALAAEMVSAFGLDDRLPEVDHGPDDDQGFFLHRLFREVVFAEAHLAGDGPPGATSSRLFRQRRWATLTALTAALLLAGLWGQAWLTTHRQLAALEVGLDDAQRLLPDGLAGGPLVDQVTESDIAPVLPVLDAIAALRKTVPAGTDAIPWAPGLDAGDRLPELAASALHRALRRLLLPRLVVRLEQHLATAPETAPQLPERLYDALKVLLMLTGQAPLDRYVVTQWFTMDWIAGLPGPEHEDDRRRLADYLETLLEGGLSVSTAGTDIGPVVAEARRRLAAFSLADRATALLRTAPELRSLPGWQLPDHTGGALSRVLVRRSGQALSEPIPGLYTRDGCLRTVLPVIAQVASDLAGEGWVSGLSMDAEAIAVRAGQLRRDLATRYFNAYARQWQDLLDDLTLAPTGTVPELLPVLAAASGPDSPLPVLARAVAAETDLPSPTPPASAATPADAGPTTAGMLGLPAGATVVTTVHAATGTDDPGWWTPAAAELGRRFATLRSLAQPGADGGPAPITAAVAALGELRQALAAWAATNRDAAAEAGVRRAADRVKALAAALPAPMAGWFAGLGEAADRALLLDPGKSP